MYIVGVFENPDGKLGKMLACRTSLYCRTVLIDSKNYPVCFNPEKSLKTVFVFSYSELFRFSELCCDILIINKRNDSGDICTLKSKIAIAGNEELREFPIYSDEIITCGSSPRNTITLSSIAYGKATFAIQREIVSLGGKIKSPHETEVSCDERSLPSVMLTLAALCALDLPEKALLSKPPSYV